MSRSEAQHKEKELRVYAEKLELDVSNVYFDRKDKHPFILLKLIEILSKNRHGIIILTDRDFIADNAVYSDALKFYIASSGLHIIPKPEQKEKDRLLQFIRAAKLYNESGAGLSAFENKGNISSFNRAAGRPCYGYSIQQGKIIEEPTESEIVREVFELCAKGLTPTEIINELINANPNRNTPARSQIVSIISNENYSRTNPLAEPDYPPIVSPKLYFDAVRVISERRKNDDTEQLFLFKKLITVDGRSFVPLIEKNHGRRPVYYSGENGDIIPSELFDRDVLKTISTKYLPHCSVLRAKCLEFSQYSRESAHKRITQLIEQLEALRIEKTNVYQNINAIPNRKEVDHFDELTAKIKLAELSLVYEEYLIELTNNAESNLSSFFGSLNNLLKLQKNEQRYLINCIAEKVILDGDKVSIFLRGTSGKFIVFRLRDGS